MSYRFTNKEECAVKPGTYKFVFRNTRDFTRK